MKEVIGQFETTYLHVLSSIEDGKDITPADLYKLDKYWQLQGQLKTELTKLGDKQHKAMSRNFMKQYERVYRTFAVRDTGAFSLLDREAAEKMINAVWCADGKSWSNRIWTNVEKLQQTLNDNLIHCVATGKTTDELKKILMKDFDVSFRRADSIVRTEMAHIQTQAARQSYLDSGVSEFEVWADKDERRCDICGQLHTKRYAIYEPIPIPAHPRCRCCIIPVIDD